MKLFASALVAGLLALGAGVAQATVALPCPTCTAPMSGSFSMTVWTANLDGTSFDALPTALSDSGNKLAGTDAITASFTYTGALSFNNNAAQNSGKSGDLNSAFFNLDADNLPKPSPITNYTGHGTLEGPSHAKYSSLEQFLDSSGSASGYKYGSLYKIDLGYLTAGSVLSIYHDDGATVFQNDAQVGKSVVAPTTAVLDTITLTSSAETYLWYARENGSPSVLFVQDVPGSVPEPASMAVLGGGIAALGMIRRRRPA